LTAKFFIDNDILSHTNPLVNFCP